MLTPNYWRFKRACDTVHKFSLEVIQKRREALQEQKVGHAPQMYMYVEVKVQIIKIIYFSEEWWECPKEEKVSRFHRHFVGGKGLFTLNTVVYISHR